MRTGALILLATLLLTLITVAYCLSNPNTLKPLAEWLTEWGLERTLAIQGDLELTLSWTPTVAVTDTQLGNAPDGAAPFMASAGYARAQIDLKALFDNRVHLLDLEVRDATLHLEDSVDGPPNWAFFEPEEGTPDTWSFMIEQLEVHDSRILASVGELAPIELTIPHFTETSDSEGHLNLQGHGTFNGDPWRLDGRVGPFDAILAAGRIELDMNLLLDDAELKARGSIDDLATFAELDLDFEVYGPDADLLGEVFNMPEVFAGDVALEASIAPDEGGHSLSVQGNVAAFQIETAGNIRDLEGLDGWDGSFAVTGPDAGVFGKALQIPGFPDGPFRAAGTVHLWGGDLDLKDVTVRTEDLLINLNADFEHFPRRQDAEANVRISGDDISEFGELLSLRNLPAEPFEVTVTLDANAIEILKSRVQVGSHVLTVTGTFGEYPTFQDTRLELAASGNDLAELLLVAGMASPPDGPYEASAVLRRVQTGLSIEGLEFLQEDVDVSGTISWADLSAPDAFVAIGEVTLHSLARSAAELGFETATRLPDHPLQVAFDVEASDGLATLREAEVAHQGMTLQADGVINPAGLSGLQLNLDLEGSSVDELFNMPVPEGEAPIPFKLQVGIAGNDDSLQINGFELSTVGGIFTANGQIMLNEHFNGSRFEIEGSGGSLKLLVPTFQYYAPPDKPWQIKGTVSLPDANHIAIESGTAAVGSITASLSGLIDFFDQTGTRVTFEASGDNVSDIGQLGEAAWPADPFRIYTELHGTVDVINIVTLEAIWGISDLAGTGRLELAGKPALYVRGRSETLDIYDLQTAVFGELEDTEPADDLTRVFPDAVIPIEAFSHYDVYTDIEVDRFRGQRARLEDVKLEVDVHDGALELKRASYRDENGYFNATAAMRPEGDGVFMTLSLQGEDADFGFLTSSQQSPETVPRYTLDVNIEGTGVTVADIAGSLNGTLLIYSDGGEINNALVDAFTGDFLSNVLEVLNPFVETEEFTKMECLVLNAAVEDGQLDLEPGFVMRTDRVNMFVYGSADLERELLDISLATQARRGIGVSAASITNPYFKVGGTLAEPALQLDPASAAIAASVATATAGLSILVRGVFDRLMGTRNPCPGFLSYEREPKETAEGG